MQNSPYSIYIDKRPLRIAFLIDPNQSDFQQLDAIFEYNHGKWGGRFNPIIFTDGSTIDEKWWQFLREVDPDVIKSLVPLQDELLEKIATFLSPYSVEVPRDIDEKSTRIGIHDEGLSIRPTSDNLAKISHPRKDLKLVLFDIDEAEDEIVKQFIRRNFGTCQPDVVQTKRFSIEQKFQSELDDGNISTDLQEQFKDQGIALSPNVTVIKKREEVGKWLIIDKDGKRTYPVEKMTNNLSIYVITKIYDGILNESETKEFLITDRESLATALKELSTSGRVIYPIQLCSLPNTFRDVEYDRTGEIFTVVVGDTIEDLVHFWNRILFVSQWKRIGLNQMWLPTELANNAEMLDSFRDLLRKFANRSGNHPALQFNSFSVEESQLKNIADKLTERLWLYKKFRFFTEPQIPKFQPRGVDFMNTGNMDFYRGTGYEAHVVLNEPDVLEGTMRGEHWMADVYIQFRHEHYTGGIYLFGHNFWWQFPQRNHLARKMFQCPSRINSDRFPSVLMTRGNPILHVRLPDEQSVFGTLITEENRSVYNTDPRTKFAHRPFYAVQPSDKGQYLSGFLDLFSSLAFAHHILNQPRWRNMFNILSKQDKDEKTKEDILGRLGKQIEKRGRDFTNPDGLEWLTNHVLRLSKEQSLTGIEQPFQRFIREFQKDLADRNSHPEENQRFEFDEEEVRREIEDLIELNILLMGFRIHCPRCGFANWYHVDDARQMLQCRGCSYSYAMPVEKDWYYRLNSLVHAGYAEHNLTPVVLVLGQLLQECRSSFIFTTSLDLFERRGKASSWDLELKKLSDLDIVCIQDGKFIIGEVKQSISGFKEEDFKKMAEFAERIKPDILLFSSLESEPSRKLVTDNIEALQRRLSLLEIEVRWYPLRILESKDDDDTVVYVARNGKKYHRERCRFLPKKVIPMKLKEAEKYYAPCRVCNRS